MSKEMYMAAHEELVEEYLERNPDADESKACDVTAGAAWDRMTDKMADAADRAADEWKDQQMEERQ